MKWQRLIQRIGESSPPFGMDSYKKTLINKYLQCWHHNKVVCVQCMSVSVERLEMCVQAMNRQ